MRWASALSLEKELAVAARETRADVATQLGGALPDLLIAFVSAQHEAEYDRLPAYLGVTGTTVLIGCSAGGVIGGRHEIEGQASLAVVGAVLPDVRVTPFHIESDPPPDTEAWNGLVRTSADETSAILLLPDSFTFDAEAVLADADRRFPNVHKVGGLASGGRHPGVHVLYEGSSVHRSGAVGLTLTGDVIVDTVVAQGCRPIGEPMFVTGCHEHVLRTLDGKPAMRVLRDLHERLTPRDQELMRHSLFLGVVMKESRESYGQGDFLVRNILGLDTVGGGVAVGARLREGSVVQFHLRDATTSAEDLETLLSRHAGRSGGVPQGALLFSCLGRGVHLYGRADHDSGIFRRHFGDVPLGGFFCNGEIGPVHGTTFVHGYTSSFALFRPRSASR
jgi:small ligand-binding sensory domain FIST